MEPKLKAKELVDKYCALHFEQKRGSIIIDLEKAKQCALIAVDEILKMIDEYDVDVWDRDVLIYWQEVKQEIEKL